MSQNPIDVVESDRAFIGLASVIIHAWAYEASPATNPPSVFAELLLGRVAPIDVGVTRSKVPVVRTVVAHARLLAMRQLADTGIDIDDLARRGRDGDPSDARPGMRSASFLNIIQTGAQEAAYASTARTDEVGLGEMTSDPDQSKLTRGELTLLADAVSVLEAVRIVNTAEHSLSVPLAAVARTTPYRKSIGLV